MTKKDPKANLKKRIKTLEAKFNEFILEFNELQKELRNAFGKVKKDKDVMAKRLTAIENMLLVGDFTTKLAKGAGLRRPPR